MMKAPWNIVLPYSSDNVRASIPTATETLHKRFISLTHMTLEHAAIWTRQLETLKDFYVRYLNGTSNEKYTNPSKGFESYFIRFEGGARLELMFRPDIPVNQNDPEKAQHLGLIHLAFGVDTMAEVDQKADEMMAAGFPILSGPRKTGDGYYEFETLDPDGNRLEVTAAWQE